MALPVRSCLIDGEAIVSDDIRLVVFELNRSWRLVCSDGVPAKRLVRRANSFDASFDDAVTRYRVRSKHRRTDNAKF